jgi:hypothetical protein
MRMQDLSRQLAIARWASEERLRQAAGYLPIYLPIYPACEPGKTKPAPVESTDKVEVWECKSWKE